MRHITPEEDASLRRVVDSHAFVHSVCAAVNAYLKARGHEREATPKGERRDQLEHLKAQLRKAQQSLQRLSPEARSALHVADRAEGGEGDVDRRLVQMLAAVQRAVGIDPPKRGEKRLDSARALRFWLVQAIEQAGLPAEPGEGGPLDYTARVAIAMIGDDAPDLRTILRNE